MLHTTLTHYPYIPIPPSAAMDPEARRRACVDEFRVKLRRDTGTNLTAAVCEELLGETFGGRLSLESDPGRGLHSSTSST